MKQGCIFYIAFTESVSNTDIYRCNGISAWHKYTTNSNTWNRYIYYRNQYSKLRINAEFLLTNEMKSENMTSYLNN